MKNQINKSAKYFRNVTVTFTTSSRRNGGYFSYLYEKIENAVMCIESGKAYITHNVSKNSTQQYGPFVTVKMTYGKSFNIVKSTEITERQYKNDLKKFSAIIDKNKAAEKVKQDEARNLLNQKIEKLEAELIIKFKEDTTRCQRWIDADCGNSHTRRTRWENRAKRLGYAGHGGNVRDLTYKHNNQNSSYWINGVQNPLFIGK